MGEEGVQLAVEVDEQGVERLALQGLRPPVRSGFMRRPPVLAMGMDTTWRRCCWSCTVGRPRLAATGAGARGRGPGTDTTTATSTRVGVMRATDVLALGRWEVLVVVGAWAAMPATCWPGAAPGGDDDAEGLVGRELDPGARASRLVTSLAVGDPCHRRGGGTGAVGHVHRRGLGEVVDDHRPRPGGTGG